jgi:glycopeptide antibiotics resistance protein
MRNYITIGIWTFVHLIPMTCIILLGFNALNLIIKLIFREKFNLKILDVLWQFLWILIVLSILKITGILGGNFGVSSPLDSCISYKLFEEGLDAATFLNLCLFIPFGFLSMLTFKNLDKCWWFGILIGFVFSAIIEFLQMFTGRFTQLDDIVMNTLGSFIGYEIGIWLVRLLKNLKKCMAY